jgi:hypothetical protein
MNSEGERGERGVERGERNCQGVPGLSFSVRLRPSEPEKQSLAWVFRKMFFN